MRHAAGQWPQYAARTAALLKPGGLLVGFFFFSDEPKGPPFGISAIRVGGPAGAWFSRERDRQLDPWRRFRTTRDHFALEKHGNP